MIHSKTPANPGATLALFGDQLGCVGLEFSRIVLPRFALYRWGTSLSLFSLLPECPFFLNYIMNHWGQEKKSFDFFIKNNY
jgi:hypothetical protein